MHAFHLVHSPSFSFVTIQSDGQTDRQTELRQQYRALHYMPHGKNENGWFCGEHGVTAPSGNLALGPPDKLHVQCMRMLCDTHMPL